MYRVLNFYLLHIYNIYPRGLLKNALEKCSYWFKEYYKFLLPFFSEKRTPTNRRPAATKPKKSTSLKVSNKPTKSKMKQTTSKKSTPLAVKSTRTW